MTNQENINVESMLKTGTVLRGTYRIDGYLSSGSFGNTYLASHVHLEEKYAIKEFFMNGVSQRKEDANDVSISNQANAEEFKKQLGKFKKEARRLRILNNNHVVRVHDLFEENGTAYYVMDYIDGEDLRKRLIRTEQPLSESEVTDILSQTLDALNEVHAHGIWHLDLKPANVMLDNNGTVRLIDFGASKQFDAKKGSATNTAVAFTSGYAPIEQMEENSDKFGPWTDFYALGATLYNLLTNKKPPRPSDINDDHTVDKHIALPLPTNVSDKMRNLILWLMKSDLKERPQSVKEIRDYLGLSSEIPQDAKNDEKTLLASGKNGQADKKRISPAWLFILGALLGVLLSSLFFFFSYSRFIHDKVNRMPVPNGTYTGSIIRGTNIRDGEGYFVNKDGERYEGTWEKDKLIYGTRTNSNSEYIGQFDDELRNHGFGIITYSDEYIRNKSRNNADSSIIVTYLGNWYKDKKHGLGRTIKKDGSMEFGEYKDGLFQPTPGANFKVGHMIYGIDASRHQNDIDWDNLALYCDQYGNVYNKSVADDNKKYMQPVFFVYLKATGGDTIIDPMYHIRDSLARSHGLVTGAYHYFTMEKDINSQLKNFFETVKWSKGDLPPALDVENKDEIKKYGINQFQESVLFWLDAVEKKMGVRPIIYTNDYFIKEDYLNSPMFEKYDFWTARYSYNFYAPPSSTWNFWQRTDSARIKGCDSYIDVNLFHGNYDSFLKYIDAVSSKSLKQ